MRTLGLFAAGLAVLAGIISPAFAAPKERPSDTTTHSLLKKATHRFSVDAKPGDVYDDNRWLSDHEYFHVSHGHFYRYDLTTKSDTPLTALDRQIETPTDELSSLAASPDGQWLLWASYGNHPAFAGSVDGSRCLQWPGNPLSQLSWCADSRHWIEFQFGGTPEKIKWTQILVHSLNTPGQSETIRAIPPGLQGLDILTVHSADLVIARARDQVKIGPSKPFTAPDGNAAFTITDQVTLRKQQEISVWSLHHAQALHRWTIDLPGYVSELAVSPDSKRIAWLLTPFPTEDSASARLAHPSEALWISDLDGRHRHQVGSFEKRVSPSVVHQLLAHPDTTSAKLTAQVEMPNQVRWLPSGHQISLEYQGAIWIVPVD